MNFFELDYVNNPRKLRVEGRTKEGEKPRRRMTLLGKGGNPPGAESSGVWDGGEG